MGKKNVSLKTIAYELSLSVNTVSHALRDMNDISEETKIRVRRKALELGYMPNQLSQKIKQGEKAVVAMLVESFDNLYFNSLCKKLFAVFAAKDQFDCQIIYLSENHIDVIKQCVLQRVDLLIAHIEFEPEVLEFAKLQNISIIKVGNNVKNLDTDIVSIDEKMGCEIAARYLWEKHSCDKFLYIDAVCELSNLRFEHYKNTLTELGAEDIKTFKLNIEDISLLDGYIAEGYKNIFCYNDDIAYRMLSMLDAIHGDVIKEIPDLNIIGFDGLCEEIVGIRPLTTVKIDYEEFAEEIYKMVDFRLKYPNEKRQKVLLPVSLHQIIK